MNDEQQHPHEPDADLDDDTAAFLEAWDEADRQAAAILRDALDRLRRRAIPGGTPATIAARLRDGISEREHPFDWIGKAAALETEPLPNDDIELVLRCAAATISPQDETGLDPEEEATLIALERADWLGAIVSVVRKGRGADASPEALARGISTCPEVELEGNLDPDDESLIVTAFTILALPWQVLGIIDEDSRLTALGAWILPRALARAWGSDFDAGSDDG